VIHRHFLVAVQLKDRGLTYQSVNVRTRPNTVLHGLGLVLRRSNSVGNGLSRHVSIDTHQP